MIRPTCIIPADQPHTPMPIAHTGEPLAETAILVSQPGLRLSHDILPPGRRSASPHAHTTQNETIYVLSGTPDLWLDGHLHRLHPGEAVVFAAGTGIGHTLLNNTDEDVRILSIALTNADDQVFYPLNPDSVAPVEAWQHHVLGPHDAQPEKRSPV